VNDAGRLHQPTEEQPLSAAGAEDAPLGGRPYDEVARGYLDDLLDGRRADAFRRVHQLTEQGVPIATIYLEVFEPVLRETGRRWQHNLISVAQEHYVTAATQLAMSQFYPRIFRTPRVGRTLVAACVGGELHEVGLRMVADLFELAGWDSHYLGSDAPSQTVAEFAVQQGADLVAISATLPSHREEVSRMVAALRNTTRIPVLVGGRLFQLQPELWRTIGADATASTAADAVDVGTSLVERAFR
jgi:MerR family transcriptional regulator, light-induced transcriptional regulator